jgi:hypothetical protein
MSGATLVRVAASLRKLREQPMMKLLVADRAPLIAALLDNLLMGDDKALSASVMEERLNRDIQILRSAGHELPYQASGYLNEWLNFGWLSRRLPGGASEEEYTLTSDAASAVRFLIGAVQPRRSATESHLAIVISQLRSLADETDGDRRSRLASLIEQRHRIDEEIAKVNSGHFQPMSDERALERAREVLHLAEELVTDFRAVREEFYDLNRGLREQLMDFEGSRGALLEKVFAGVDVIGESDAGKTFNAFWRLLNDPEQSAVLHEAIDAVSTRSFSRSLNAVERRLLRNLTTMLLDEGSAVHETQQTFARSLKHFVKSREFRENRRLHGLIRQSMKSALDAKERVRANAGIDFMLTFTGAKISSVAQWGPLDPASRIASTDMELIPEGELSLDDFSEMVRQSEIDIRSLKKNIVALLSERDVVSLNDLLERYDAEQGLGTVVGYISLAQQHGKVVDESPCQIEWTGTDGERRHAQAPSIFFLRKDIHELEF